MIVSRREAHAGLRQHLQSWRTRRRQGGGEGALATAMTQRYMSSAKVEDMFMCRLLVTVVALLWSASAFAHTLWLEPDGDRMRLFYGEFGENLREASPGLLDRLALPVARIGDRQVMVERTATSFLLGGTRQPAESAAAEQRRVAERKQGDKVARVLNVLGARWAPDPGEREPWLALEILPTPKPGTFKVLYLGKPVAKAKVELIAESGWKKEFRTEPDGTFLAALPFKGGYVMEAEHLDATAGSHAGEAYDTMRFVTTLSFRVAEGLEGPPRPPITVPKREMK